MNQIVFCLNTSAKQQPSLQCSQTKAFDLQPTALIRFLVLPKVCSNRRVVSNVSVGPFACKSTTLRVETFYAESFT